MTPDPIFYGKPLSFRAGVHRYYWGDEPVPSVTTIINRLSKPLLIQWAADCAVEFIANKLGSDEFDSRTLPELYDAARKAHAVIRDTAGDVGTLVHDYAKDLMADKVVRERKALPEQGVRAIAALHAWKQQHKIEPIAIERRVFSRQFMYAGTCDFFGAIDGNLAVLDFKTGNGVYDEAWYQMAGYHVALREELPLGNRPMQHWLVHLNKNTGEFATYVRDSSEHIGCALRVWRALVEVDRGIRGMPKMAKAKR
jgi:hypothetical protein